MFRLTLLLPSCRTNKNFGNYVHKNRSKKVPQRILRITDHRPTLQKYVRPDAPLPSEEIHSNISIEFFTKKYDEDGDVRGQESDIFEYVAKNDRKHHSMSAALNQYLLFVEDREKRFKE